MIVVRIALGRRHKLKHVTVYTYWSICPSCRPPGIPSMFVHVVRSVELEVIGRRVHRIRAVSCRLQKYARSPKDQRSPCGEIRLPRKSSSLVRLISNTTSPRIYSVFKHTLLRTAHPRTWRDRHTVKLVLLPRSCRTMASCGPTSYCR